MGKKVNFQIPFNQDINNFVFKQFHQYDDFRIIKQSLDARGAPSGKTPRYNYTIELINKGEQFCTFQETFKTVERSTPVPIIVGMGPAGLFCALRLLEYGIKSILIERGECARRRMVSIAKYWRTGVIDLDNNVCFGEGGAGLFSDGKLTTRVKSPYIQYIMNTLVNFGAPKEVAYLSNPHLGSNKMKKLVSEITSFLKINGCVIHYNTQVTNILLDRADGLSVQGVQTKDGKKIYSKEVVLATGHSASDMYTHLSEQNIAMAPKNFAVGVRVEHPRKLIDRAQFGQFAGNKQLGASNYRLSCFNKIKNRGVYSFCMCPGGYVLSSGTDQDGIVVNGMSNYDRNSPWSNSGLVVTVEAGRDFALGADNLGGIRFQREIENKAFCLSKANASAKEVPACNLMEFLKEKNKSSGLLKSSVPSGIFHAQMNQILPAFVVENLQEAMVQFDRKIKGFISKEALILAPETRTSAPVTILRDRETLESDSCKGLYPCGEGAGYAGGITSAAIDGVKAAMSIVGLP
ncbi:MAG: FAD-dependent oxidoreductase [Bacteriovoracaceae bacterium]|nr:FAD-dependent oxidoreductase [Bacteriovoracaceae bacterium]